MPRSFSPRIFLAPHRPQERSLECYFRRPRLSGSLYRTVGIFMSRVPGSSEPLCFARVCSLACTSLVIAGLGVRESFTVVRTRLPLALVLNYGGPSSAFPPPPLSPCARHPSTFICAHAVVSEPRKSTTKVAVPPELYRLSMEVRPVGALRQKFKARYMRRDGGENRIRVAVPRGYISSQGYPIRSPRHGMIE